jgi:hypothetical protein
MELGSRASNNLAQAADTRLPYSSRLRPFVQLTDETLATTQWFRISVYRRQGLRTLQTDVA